MSDKYPKKDPQAFSELLGGEGGVMPESTLASTPAATFAVDAPTKGVYARHPASRPKHYVGVDPLKVRNSMARMLIPLPNETVREEYLNSFKGTGVPSQLVESLAAVGQSGQDNKLGAGMGFGYIDFVIEQVQEGFTENRASHSLQSDNHVTYFSGMAPPVFSYSGILQNTLQDDWRAAFTVLYLKVLRGTQLARRRVRVALAYDRMVVLGSIVATSQILRGTAQNHSRFNFSLEVSQLDVSLTTGRGPTPLTEFPEYLNPGDFALENLDPSKKTIRAVGVPADTTTSRKKSQNDDENPYGNEDLLDGNDGQANTYNGETVTSGVEDMVDILNGLGDPF